MARTLAGLVVGLLLGAGLAVSGMINPFKVLSFLDFFGDWDPTLAFVMAGAIIAAAPGFHLAKQRGRPLLDDVLRLPTNRKIDAPLLVGAAVFGMGWGLVGFCPGPALAALSTGAVPAIVFVAAMTAGILAHRVMRPK